MFALKGYGTNLTLPPMPPPQAEGWERQWHGYYQMTKTRTDSEKRHAAYQALFSRDYYHEGEVEILAFLTLLDEIKNDHVNFWELGAGRGPWCMAVAAAAKFKLVPRPPSSYRILAVEAEPTHLEWTREHLSRQGIDAQVVHGAVTGRVGRCRFKADDDPAAHMGQCVRPDGNIEVPTYTIDHLRRTYGFNRVDLIHMDLQGQEVEAIKGARESLKGGLIGDLIVGTHGEALEQELKAALTPTHDLVLELPQLGTRQCPGLEKELRSHVDGVHVYRRRAPGL